MAIKPTTTSQMITRSKVTGETMSSFISNWFRILKARAQALASDGDHTFTYRDRDALTKNTTRQQIVDIYETAYSELAESFHGHLERIDELDGEVATLLRSNQHLEDYATKLRQQLDTAQRRVNGLLTVIEKEIPPEIYP